MENLCFCTISSKNRLAHARVLAASLLTHHPGAQIFLLLVDNIENYFDPLKEKMKLIEARKLNNVSNVAEMFFKYNSSELSNALKPYFFEYLFKDYNVGKLVYLDSDIYVTKNMNELSSLLENFSIILTPHITKPLPLDRNDPNELAILRAGTFNAGFISISNKQETLNFLSWWKTRLWHFGLSNPAEEMAADQRWLDLVPNLFKKVHILKDPTYNVAYWNIHERKLSFSGEKILINGKLLRFFHFSGFDPNNVESISKYQTRYKLTQFPKLRPLFKLYKRLLKENGYDTVCTWPYSHNFFDNGSKIPDRARRIYWSLGNKSKKFGNPFETNKKNSFKKYYSIIFPMRYKCLVKIIEVGKRYKKFLNKFPRLAIQARKFYMFLDFLVNTKASNFFVRK